MPDILDNDMTLTSKIKLRDWMFRFLNDHDLVVYFVQFSRHRGEECEHSDLIRSIVMSGTQINRLCYSNKELRVYLDDFDASNTKTRITNLLRSCVVSNEMITELKKLLLMASPSDEMVYDWVYNYLAPILKDVLYSFEILNDQILHEIPLDIKLAS